MPIVRKGRTATITLPTWTVHIIKKYNLQRYDLTPVIARETAQSWSADKKLKRKSQYVFDADRSYKETKLRPVISGNAIGFDERGDTIFLYLKNINGKKVISKRVRNKALQGFKKMEFAPCTRSGRKELKGAQAFNNRKGGTFAGEYNTGWMHLGGIFKIGHDRTKNKEKRRIAKHNDKLVAEYMLPLLRTMSHIYARTLPKAFGTQNVKIRSEHRHGETPFSTLTFLQSAPAAVHLDARNGAGSLACMTTVDTPKKYKGGAFCFVEYGVEIRVTPGDLLIAATPFHWHANLTPVEGEKYSIICYFKDALQRKRKIPCSECGVEFLGFPNRKKPRCPKCLEDRSKK